MKNHGWSLYSCIKSYEHSCLKLFLNRPEAVFKQQNSCSNHGIHVLFEHGFWTFDITRWALLCLRYIEWRNVIALNIASEGHCATGVIVNNILNLPSCWFTVAFEEIIWSLYGALGAILSQFSVRIVSYARTTIIYGYFIAITFAGFLGRYLNTRPSGLVFKQLPRDPANVNAWKTMGDPYILA